jgi:hypothetical protein
MNRLGHETEQFRVSTDQMLKDLHDIIHTHHIAEKGSMKCWNNRSNIDIAREVFQELVERETTGRCVNILK